jgi:hypothetical protein
VGVDGPGFPRGIAPGEELRWSVPLPSTKQAATTVEARFIWEGNSDTTLRTVIPSYPVPIAISSPDDINVRPGDETQIIGTVSLPVAVTDPIIPRINIQIERSRMALQAEKSVVWIEHAGIRETAIAAITQQGQFIEISFADPVAMPAVLGFDIRGMALLGDPRPAQVDVRVFADDCLEYQVADFTISTELCGDALRMVRFVGGVAVALRSSLVSAGEDIILDVEAKEPTQIGAVLEDMSGRRMLLWEKLSLNKGHSVLKFHNSVQASGLYRLVLQHGNGDVLLPLILVK